jgi:hypothetical protein
MLVIKPGFEVSKMIFGYKHDKKKEKKQKERESSISAKIS